MTKSSTKSSLKFDAAVGRIYGPVWSRMLQITQSDLAEWPGNENVLTTDILRSSFRILINEYNFTVPTSSLLFVAIISL